MVATVSSSATVSRTSSASSIDFTINAFNAAEQRRTRKRITGAQLAHLEELYSRHSHPTRDQRDALAKRIQMETKSVTIWFQNKRQTDRKVALHNATNSRNEAARGPSSDKPNITLTTPTSPAYPPEGSVSQDEGSRPPSDRLPRKQSTIRSNALRRTTSSASSNASSNTSVASSSSTTSVFRARPSLDRVASRSEIRFTNRAPSRGTSGAMFVGTNGSSGSDNLVRDATSISAPLPGMSSTVARSDSSVSVPPASPPPSTDPPLWTTMLSSPLTPSSPPPVEFLTYTRARKTRTLDWACTAARLARGIASLEEFAKLSPTSRSSLGPAISLSLKDMDAREREYEEATAMTEDEAELVTPHGSQDVSMHWAGDPSDTKTVARICHSQEAMHAMGMVHESNRRDVMVVDAHGWEEDEMHAALALCGLRG